MQLAIVVLILLCCAYYTVRADCFDASILGGSLESIRARYK